MKPIVRKTLIAFILVLLIAPIKFSILGIPFVLQSLALFVAGAVLGIFPGLVISMAYIIVGALGLPVFADFNGGWEKLTGPTAGFLWSFPLVVSYLAWQCKIGEQSIFHYITYFFRAHILWLIPGMLILYQAMEGVDMLATLVKLMPDVLVKSLAGGILAYFLVQKIPPEA